MHYPPEVRFMVPASPWHRRLFIAVGLLASFQVIGFASLNWKPVWQTILVGVSLLAATLFSWQRASQPVIGVLDWDGTQWQWSELVGTPIKLKRHVDLQSLMLISLEGGNARPVWLWLQRATDPGQWLALRRAVAFSTSPLSTHRVGGALPSSRATP